ncbi:MAG: hypothetical protein QM770_10635 [Tepidisphaeraceae bacterium]
MWFILTLLFFALGTTVALLFLAALLHGLPKLNSTGRAIGDWLCRAPGLDVLITIFTVLPLFVGGLWHGWAGLLGGIAGMYGTLYVWIWAHEMGHPEAQDKPRIVKVNNAVVGPFNNWLALFVTSWAVPVFWIVRMAELIVYPPLIWIVKLPRYRAADWVNVSRHKFTGLVGHDRIWCLYCDWMTGVWSLGSEMLRNIESFWCPIRFQSDLKCENCKTDFPDVANGWAPFESDSVEAARVLERKYATEPRPPSNAWFGHPVRLTVKGQTVETPTPSEPANPIAPAPTAIETIPPVSDVLPTPVEVRPIVPPEVKPFSQEPIPLAGDEPKQEPPKHEDTK